MNRIKFVGFGVVAVSASECTPEQPQVYPHGGGIHLTALKFVAHSSLPSVPETAMNEETFNISIRKFLKMVGVNSQREIEQAVAKAMAAGAIDGQASLPATMTLAIEGLKLNVKFDGRIDLE